MKIQHKFIVFATCIAVAGCSPLAPRPDSSKYFILTPLAGDVSTPAQVSPTADSQLTIGLGPIDFPDYLRRLEVVTRAAPNQIYISEEQHWAEPLDKNFARVLSEDLARLLKTQKIEKYPWPHRTQPDYQIAVDVQRFETGTDSQSQLVVRWIIKDGNSKDLYASETIASTPVASGDAGDSAALSSDLATLSQAIAAEVSLLNRQRTERINTATTRKTPRFSRRHLVATVND